MPEKASGSTHLVCIWRKGAHKSNLSNLSLITEPLNTSVQALKGRCTRWQESRGRDLDLIPTVRASGQNPFPSLALSFLVAELGLGSKGPSSSVSSIGDWRLGRGAENVKVFVFHGTSPGTSAPKDASVAMATAWPAWSPEARGGSWEEPCPYQDGGSHRAGGGVELSACPDLSSVSAFSC